MSAGPLTALAVSSRPALVATLELARAAAV